MGLSYVEVLTHPTTHFGNEASICSVRAGYRKQIVRGEGKWGGVNVNVAN